MRSIGTLEALFARIIDELQLRPVSAPIWHQFPGEGGVTGVVLLSESHLSVHTFPESGFAAFNLYCCRPRPAWTWDASLTDLLGARHVQVASETAVPRWTQRQTAAGPDFRLRQGFGGPP